MSRSQHKGRTQQERLRNFKCAVKYGPIFPCSCCEQMMFDNGVSIIDDNVRSTIEKACNDKIDRLFENIFESKLDNPSFSVYIDSNTNWYLCHTCKKHLTKGQMPSMSAANGLKVTTVPKHLQLTEMANNLIAKKILFQKIFRLPTSLMPATRDRLINIPIGEDDVMNTLHTLPRTPSQAGITTIDVKLKRKKMYKNYVHYTTFFCVIFFKRC